MERPSILVSVSLRRPRAMGGEISEVFPVLSSDTNDEITEYARVWTGFRSNYKRGGVEDNIGENTVDPMSKCW